MSGDKPLEYLRSQRAGAGKTKHVFQADGDALADKVIELHRWLRENTAGPAEALILLNNTLDMYRETFGITGITVSENPPQ